MSTYIKCEYCGIDFIADRISAKYCCVSHKTLACRERKKLERIACERQLQQERIEKIRAELEKEEQQRKEQAIAEQVERKQLEEKARLIRDENNLKEEKKSRIDLKQKHKKEKEKKSKQADFESKTKILAGITVLGLLNKFLDLIPDNGNAPRSHNKIISNTKPPGDSHINDAS